METEDIRVLVSSATTNGAFTILTESGPPGYGPPPHIHSLEDEFMMPLEGQFELFSDGQWKALDAFGFHTLRGNLHTWRNSGTATGTIMSVASPGGFDRFLKELAALRTPDQVDQLLAISGRYGITYPKL